MAVAKTIHKRICISQFSQNSSRKIGQQKFKEKYCDRREKSLQQGTFYEGEKKKNEIKRREFGKSEQEEEKENASMNTPKLKGLLAAKGPFCV